MIHRIWQLLLSVRTALVLILVTSVATFAGTLVMQVPNAIDLGGPAFQEWVESVRPRYGMWTDALALVGFFNVFRSWWYELLVAALALSLLACSIHRWSTVTREVLHPQVRVAASVFGRPGVVAATTAERLDGAAAAVGDALAHRGYRVLSNQREDAVQLYADRNRFARFGTILAHASLVLLLGAAAIGSRVGYSNDGLSVPVGSTRDIGYGGLSVEATSFVVEYYPTGEPKDYRSELVLYHDRNEVERATVRVNEPLDYKGVRIYQSFFGPAAAMRVSDASGQVLVDENVALAWNAGGNRPAGSLGLPSRSMTAYLIAPSTNGNDAVIRPGQLRLELYQNGSSDPLAVKNLVQGQDAEVSGLHFTFERERQFTGLRVAEDPTLPFIWIGSLLLVLGFAVALVVPYRRLWVRVEPAAEGTRIAIFTTDRRDPTVAVELSRIAEDAARRARAARE